MIRLLPVKAAAVDDEDFFIPQQIQGELFIVGDVKFVYIDPWKDVKSRFGLHRAETGNVVDGIVDIFPLFIDPAAGNNVALHALMAAQSRMHNGLSRPD